MFKKCMLPLSLILAMFLVTGNVYSANTSQATGFVKKAIDFYKANGKEKLLAAITDGKFMEGDVYVFAYNLDGVILAIPVNKPLIGKNLLNVPDADGKMYRKEINEKAKSIGKGWVDYKYKNPVSKKIEQKTTYFEKVDDLILCCGIYK
jgi:cytochrome c